MSGRCAARPSRITCTRWVAASGLLVGPVKGSPWVAVELWVAVVLVRRFSHRWCGLYRAPRGQIGERRLRTAVSTCSDSASEHGTGLGPSTLKWGARVVA